MGGCFSQTAESDERSELSNHSASRSNARSRRGNTAQQGHRSAPSGSALFSDSYGDVSQFLDAHEVVNIRRPQVVAREVRNTKHHEGNDKTSNHKKSFLQKRKEQGNGETAKCQSVKPQTSLFDILAPVSRPSHPAINIHTTSDGGNSDLYNRFSSQYSIFDDMADIRSAQYDIVGGLSHRTSENDNYSFHGPPSTSTNMSDSSDIMMKSASMLGRIITDSYDSQEEEAESELLKHYMQQEVQQPREETEKTHMEGARMKAGEDRKAQQMPVSSRTNTAFFCNSDSDEEEEAHIAPVPHRMSVRKNRQTSDSILAAAADRWLSKAQSRVAPQHQVKAQQRQPLQQQQRMFSQKFPSYDQFPHTSATSTNPLISSSSYPGTPSRSAIPASARQVPSTPQPLNNGASPLSPQTATSAMRNQPNAFQPRQPQPQLQPPPYHPLPMRPGVLKPQASPLALAQLQAQQQQQRARAHQQCTSPLFTTQQHSTAAAVDDAAAATASLTTTYHSAAQANNAQIQWPSPPVTPAAKTSPLCASAAHGSPAVVWHVQQQNCRMGAARTQSRGAKLSPELSPCVSPLVAKSLMNLTRGTGRSPTWSSPTKPALVKRKYLKKKKLNSAEERGGGGGDGSEDSPPPETPFVPMRLHRRPGRGDAESLNASISIGRF